MQKYETEFVQEKFRTTQKIWHGGYTSVLLSSKKILSAIGFCPQPYFSIDISLLIYPSKLKDKIDLWCYDGHTLQGFSPKDIFNLKYVLCAGGINTSEFVCMYVCMFVCMYVRI